MKNVDLCKKLIFQKISTYFIKLKHYPKIVTMVKKWLKENSTLTVNKPKVIQLRNFKLGKFQNMATCQDVNWPKRLFEEEQKLEQLLTFYRETRTNLSLIRAEFEKFNYRILDCTLQFMPIKAKSPTLVNFKIRLPLKYPFMPPKACDFSLYEFIKHHHDIKRWDNDDPNFKGFRFACLGKIDSRWQKNGSMGIAHYIQMLCYYAAFDHFSFQL